MSPKLPVVNGADLVRAFERDGWTRLRQTGSHVRMQRGGMHVTIPLHKPLRPGTLAALLKDAGMIADAPQTTTRATRPRTNASTLRAAATIW